MKTLRPRVFSLVRFGTLRASATAVIAFAPNGVSPAHNTVPSVAVSSEHSVSATILTDRLCSYETAPPLFRCSGSGCNVMRSGTMTMPLQQVF